MGQLISSLYIYLKSICPPCIEYTTVDVNSYIPPDTSCNVCVPPDQLELIQVELVVEPVVEPVKEPIVEPVKEPIVEPILVPIVEQVKDTIVPLEPIVQLESILPEANVVNPFIPKQSLSDILRYKYKISIEKSKILAEKYRTLKSILELTTLEIANCKNKSGRKFGIQMGITIYNLLHAQSN